MQRRQGCCGRSDPGGTGETGHGCARSFCAATAMPDAGSRNPENVCNGDDRCPKMSVVILPGGMR